jgi:hypothetical protein
VSKVVSFQFAVLSNAKRGISDQISAIRKQERDHTENAESAEFAEESREGKAGLGCGGGAIF